MHKTVGDVCIQEQNKLNINSASAWCSSHTIFDFKPCQAVYRKMNQPSIRDH